MNGDNKEMFDLMEDSVEESDTVTKVPNKKEIWKKVGIVSTVVAILALLSCAIFMIASSNKPSVEPSEPVSSMVVSSKEEVSSKEVSSKEEVSSETVSEKPYVPKKPTYPSVAKKQYSPAVCEIPNRAPTDTPIAVYFIGDDPDYNTIYKYSVAEKELKTLIKEQDYIPHDETDDIGDALRPSVANFYATDAGVFYCTYGYNAKMIGNADNREIVLLSHITDRIANRAENTKSAIFVDQGPEVVEFNEPATCDVYHILPNGAINHFPLASIKEYFYNQDPTIYPIISTDKYLYFWLRASNDPNVLRLDLNTGAIDYLFRGGAKINNFHIEHGWILCPQGSDFIFFNEKNNQTYEIAFTDEYSYEFKPLNVDVNGTAFVLKNRDKTKLNLYKISPNGEVVTHPVTMTTDAVANDTTVFYTNTENKLCVTDFSDTSERLVIDESVRNLQLHDNWVYFIKESDGFLYRVNINNFSNVLAVTDCPVTKMYEILF